MVPASSTAITCHFVLESRSGSRLGYHIATLDAVQVAIFNERKNITDDPSATSELAKMKMESHKSSPVVTATQVRLEGDGVDGANDDDKKMPRV